VVRGDGELVTTRDRAAEAASLEIEFADGTLSLGDGADTPRKPAKPAPKPKDPPKEQGNLF
jgi:exodeoxyribonuclease VII large subunit